MENGTNLRATRICIFLFEFMQNAIANFIHLIEI